MSRARTDSKLFRSGGSVGKPGRKPALGGSSVAAAPAPMPVKESQESSQQVDPDLTRALMKIFEKRNCNHGSSHNNSSSNGSSKNSSEESCLTLFGRKLGSPSSSMDGSDGNTKNVANQYSRQGTDKLPPAATAHLLKELHKQKLKQRGITATPHDFPDIGEIEFVHTEKRPEVSTLPLLNNLQEKRPLENIPDCSSESKRQRIEKDKTLDLSLSVEFGSPDEPARDSNNTQSMDIVAEERTDATVKNPEQLTLFYNGQVLVYDDVPTDKAKAIMVLASSISSKTSCYTPCLAEATAAAAQAAKAATSPAIVVPTTAKASNSLYPSPKGTTPASDNRSSSNDVQARKASISRFLVKRKDRLSAKPAEKAEASSKASAKDTSSRSRSPSPPASSSPVTPPRGSPPRCGAGLVDELKLHLEKGEMLKRSIPANGAAAGAAGAAVTRQWIGV